MSISIRKLNKVYPNGNHALKDVCLEIPTGMFGLLGPNGAGKSTLMRILVALMEPTSGEVNICGYDLMRQRKEIRGVLGYLPQDFRFFAKYKTYEFLDYAARLSGMNCKSLRKNAVDEMLENVGLFDVRDRYAIQLHVLDISPTIWVERIIVTSFSLTSDRRLRKRIRSSGSSPVVGSSTIITFG